MQISIANLLSCYIQGKSNSVGMQLPINKYLGYVKTVTMASGDTIYKFPFAGCLDTQEQCGSVSKNKKIGLLNTKADVGVLWVESASPITRVKSGSGKHCVSSYETTMKIVWIINHLKIVDNEMYCTCLYDYITAHLSDMLYSFGFITLECQSVVCGVTYTDLDIFDVTILQPTPVNAFGNYSEALYQSYSQYPYEFGCINVGVRYKMCDVLSYDFVVSDGLYCPVPVKI